jgi:hypothetical protein
MGGASSLDPDNLPLGDGTHEADGRSTGALGPSDSSDTGSDVSSGGALDPAVLASDTDASGTGEDAGAPGPAGGRPDRDVGFDRVVGREQAGLGAGLDQAEEALGHRTGAAAMDERPPDDDASLDADAPSPDAPLDPDLAVDPLDEASIDADQDLDGDDEGLDGDDGRADDGRGARLGGAAHGIVDDDDGGGGGDDDTGRDEDEDEADENEGEPPKPGLEAPGPEQHLRGAAERPSH